MILFSILIFGQNVNITDDEFKNQLIAAGHDTNNDLEFKYLKPSEQQSLAT